jgi:thiamine biosynthesis lipoprotein
MKIITLLLIYLSLLLTGCDNEPATRQATFFAFGTEIDVSLYDVDQQTASSTVKALETAFSNVNNDWHAWQPSTLTNINQAISNGGSIKISPEVTELILFAKQLAQDSQHLFNPAAGKLFEIWGFHQDNWYNSHPPPTQQELENWLAKSPSMDDIHIDNGELSSTNRAVKLGFGAFAKGVAVDTAIEALKKHNINNAIINIDGDLRAIGSHGKRPWIIGIPHPRHQRIIASVAIKQDESVFTSADYKRFFLYEGKRYTHIIDPRTAYPAEYATSVTVLHNNASIADVAATALFVAGDDWPNIAKSMGIDYVMLVRSDGNIEMSPKMKERTRLSDENKQAIIREI